MGHRSESHADYAPSMKCAAAMLEGRGREPASHEWLGRGSAT